MSKQLTDDLEALRQRQIELADEAFETLRNEFTPDFLKEVHELAQRQASEVEEMLKKLEADTNAGEITKTDERGD